MPFIRRLICSLIPLLAMLSVVSCRTADKGKTAPSETPPLAVTAPVPAVCLGKQSVVCPMVYQPVFCHALRVGMPPDQGIQVWASNTCKGELEIIKRGCDGGWSQDDLDSANCRPDTNVGACPPPDNVCPGEKVTTGPTLCIADQYAGHALPSQGEIRAYGIDACAAKAGLSVQACRDNLNPAQLGGIHCSEDPTGGECIAPRDPPDCLESLQRAATCSVTRALGVKLDTPIVAEGISSCAAKRWLVYKACQRGLKPSALEEVVCRFKK